MDIVPSPFEQTEPITQDYIKKILPYETIIESIALQNKELYLLQKKYIQMLDNVKNMEPVTAEDENLLKIRETDLIVERKKFIEQALVANEAFYKNEYLKKKNQLQEEIQIKTQLQAHVDNKKNISINLNEDVFRQLLEQNKGNQQSIKTIKEWKKAFEMTKSNEN